MENASKALLMAGGMLIALLVIGALILMFNQLSYYQKTNSNNKKESQLVDFNKKFVQYTYDDIRGYELISLINKVIDYNLKTGVGNSVDYDKKITLYVQLGNQFADKYGVSGELKIFKKNLNYEIITRNNKFSDAIAIFSGLEKEYTLATMNQLSANYDTIKKAKEADNSGNAMKEKIKEITGKYVDITLEKIEQYREYSEFKRSTFKCKGSPIYHDNGQIKELSFVFEK